MQYRNLDEVRRTLVQHAGATAYLQLFQRVARPGSSGEASQSIARYDVTARLARPQEEDRAIFDDDGEDDGDGEPRAKEKGEPPWIQQAMTWLQHRSSMFVQQSGLTAKFQVKLFRQGGAYLTSCTFICAPDKPGASAGDTAEMERSMEALLSADMGMGGLGDSALGIDPTLYPTVDEIEGQSNLQLLELVGVTGSLVTKLVMPTMRQMMGQMLVVNRQLMLTNEVQRRTLGVQDERIRELTAEVRGYEAAQAADTRDREQRNALVGKVVDEVGAFSRVYIAAKTGVPPELAPLLEVIQNDPKLREALSRPDLHAYLRDNEERGDLVDMLNRLADFYAAKKKAQQEASDRADNPTTGGTSNSSSGVNADFDSTER